MHIKLDNHYRNFTNGFAEHEVEGKTISECMSDLCNRYPQLLVHLQDNDLEMCKKSGAKLNGELLCDEAAPYIEVTADDVLEITMDLPTGEGEVGRWIGTIVLLVVAVVLTVVSWGATSPIVAAIYGSFATSFFVAAGISAVFTAISYAFDPSLPGGSSDVSLLNNSATYTFNGISNTTASGTAINLIYGTHRVGGHLLNVYTTVEEEVIAVSGEDVLTNSSYLYYQIGLSEGEIAGVSEIEINKLPVSFYNEVTTVPEADYLRLGTSTQTSMPQFSKIQSTVTVGRKVLSIPNSTLTNTPVDFSEYQPMYGIVWDNSLEYYDQTSYGKYQSGMFKPQFSYYDEPSG